MKTDILVIGSGIAGLTFALKTAKALPRSRITVICKGTARDTNTQLAQGGIAVVTDLQHDSFKQHTQDTLKAGAGVCNKNIVRMIVREGPARLQELIEEGAIFDKGKNQSLDLAREGGHSIQRVVHAGDHSGQEIQNTLLRNVLNCGNLHLLEEMMAIDLLTENKGNRRTNTLRCTGALVLNEKSKRLTYITAGVTLMAGGGLGQLYTHTTNSDGACGDGIAMAHRAGAKIKHMAFVQFHPTALYEENTDRNFLISEAVRGAGAILKDLKGRAFMKKHDQREDLATRDIVSRAIQSEMKRTGDPFVLLDCRMIPEKYFRSHFPTIYKKCRSIGINPGTGLIPVVPSAHYCCGGIATDAQARTSIQNLYAVGENACTGLHGANRLASNSLLEALVFSHRAMLEVVRYMKTFKEGPPLVTKKKSGTEKHCSEKEIRDTIVLLKKTMSNCSGITTNKQDLGAAIASFSALQKKYASPTVSYLNVAALELRNRIDTSLLILRDAKKRRKNRGVFFNTDLAE